MGKSHRGLPSQMPRGGVMSKEKWKFQIGSNSMCQIPSEGMGTAMASTTTGTLMSLAVTARLGGGSRRPITVDLEINGKFRDPPQKK